MPKALFQANTKKALNRKCKEFTNGPMAQFRPRVIRSGYNEEKKMWYTEYEYDSTD